MQILFFCPRWGCEHLDWDAFCHKVKEAGFHGIEAGVPFDEYEKAKMAKVLEKYKLLFIGQYWQSFEKDISDHKNSYEKHLDNMMELKPVKIDSQTGKDYFNFLQNKELFDLAYSFSKNTGIPVAHETHRNKALFAAHVTKQYLEKLPLLEITADLSHWCVVSESFLEDQEEAIDLAIQHTIHIHARVGHPQGPQVTDPRLPEWQMALEKHFVWWKKIYQHHKMNGKKELTITTEFGPVPYLPTAPGGKLLADQWEINVWMMEYLKREL